MAQQPQKQPIMGPDQVRATLNDALGKVQSGQLQPEAFVDCICQMLVNQAATDIKLVETCRGLNQRLAYLEGGAQPPAQAPAANGNGQPAVAGTIQHAPPPAPNAPITETRLGMDGNPMTPEEEARERAMDAAIEAGRQTGEAS